MLKKKQAKNSEVNATGELTDAQTDIKNETPVEGTQITSTEKLQPNFTEEIYHFIKIAGERDHKLIKLLLDPVLGVTQFEGTVVLDYQHIGKSHQMSQAGLRELYNRKQNQGRFKTE